MVPFPGTRRPRNGGLTAMLLAGCLTWLFVLTAALLPLAAAASAIPEDATAPPQRAARPAAPAAVTWSNFAPSGWVTSVPFGASVRANSPNGLEPLSDAYSFSTDGGASWSAWSTNLDIKVPDFTTHDLSVTGLTFPDSASLNFIRFRVNEIGAGTAVSPNYLVKVDATPPGAPQNLTADPATWSNLGSFTVNWTNPYDVSPIVGAWYKLDSAPSGPNDGKYVATTTSSISGITPSSNGAHPIYVWLQDSFGRANHLNASMTTLYWDTVAPDPPSRMAGSPARTWTNVNSFTESWKNPDDLSGITGAYYKLNVVPSSATDGTYVPTVNSISGIAVPADGQHDIWVWLVDAAGNVDHTSRTGDPDVFWYDGTLPVSSMSVTPPLPATGWYTTSVTFTFGATDLPEDPQHPPVVYYLLDSGQWTAGTQLNLSTEGSHRLQYQARDKAGNVEPAKEMLFGIDKTAPVVTLQADRLPNSSGWYTSTVTYSLIVTDAVSGQPRGYYRLNDGPWQTGSSFELAAEGSYRIEYYGQDAAGNRTAVATTEAHVDATPPVTGQAVEGTAGENGWYLAPVTVRLLPTDAGSGVAATKYLINSGSWQSGLQFPLTVDAVYDVAYYSTDVSGNAETPVAAQVKLDSVAPGAPVGLQASPAGWSRTNAYTVQWTSPADLSGVDAAYVKLSDLATGVPPNGPRDGTVISQTSRIENLAVPGEGSYRLYLWLRDAAGNVDHKTAPAAGPILRYDATPPITSAQLQGVQGSEGWYRSSVTVTITASDPASGISVLRYRVNGGAWQSTTKPTAVLTLTQANKHLVEHYAEDVAGNIGQIAATTVRIDLTPPASPRQAQVLPEGWSGFNSFRIEWPVVTDQSGVAGAYVRFDTPPAHVTDGTLYPGVTDVNGVKAPSEGRHTVYVWLQDMAGNADHRTAVAISDAVWYDATPPVTEVSSTAASGLNGWYVEPVTFLMSATDAASGVREIRVQVDDGAWQPAGPTFVLSEEGRHTVRISGVDRAGNIEPPHVFSVAIDYTPPALRFTGPALYQSRARFEVSWSGADDASGLDAFEVEYRDGLAGPWQPWLQDTQLTAAQFDGQRGHTYFFQARATDRAGNEQTEAPPRKVIVETILNGGFDAGTFADWHAGGELFLAVVPTSGPGNVSILAARLGDEDYGPSLSSPGTVPVGNAHITQTIRIPDANQMREPRLMFWYRVLTYDVIYSENYDRFVDTLEASLLDEKGNEVAVLLRAGNPTNNYGTLYDTGWQFANIDLRPYAGQTLTLMIANWNRKDNLLNTWSFVDQIQIRDPIRSYVPLLQKAGPAAAQGENQAARAGEGPEIDFSVSGEAEGIR